MKLDTITENLKNGIYGDQGINPSSAESYVWANLGAYITDPLRDKMYADVFLKNALIVNAEEDSFDTTLDFPSVSYISSDFEYNYTNQVGLSGTYSVAASKRLTLPLINVITPSEDSVSRFLFDVKFETKFNDTYEYKVEVTFPDAVSDSESRVKEITVTPRVIPGENYKALDYITNSKMPQFFDVEESDETTAVDLQVELPSFLGDTYTITVTLEEYGNYSDDESEASIIYVLDNEITDVDGNISFSQSEFTPEVNIESIADFTIIEPTFSIFVMTDQDVNKMMDYIVTVFNYTSDEAESGTAQLAAFREFNTNLKGYPSKIFYEIIPDEFKKDATSAPRNAWNSGIKLTTRVY